MYHTNNCFVETHIRREFKGFVYLVSPHDITVEFKKKDWKPVSTAHTKVDFSSPNPER